MEKKTALQRYTESLIEQGFLSANNLPEKTVIHFLTEEKQQIEDAFEAARHKTWMGGRYFGNDEHMELTYEDANSYYTTTYKTT